MPPVNPTTHPPPAPRFLAPLAVVLGLVVVLLVGVGPAHAAAGTAPGPTATVVGTGVGAHNLAHSPLVEGPDGIAAGQRRDNRLVAAKAAVGSRVAPQTTIGFAPGEGVSALTANRLQHGTAHLSKAGVLPPWSASKSPQMIRDSLSPVLERPTATFDHVLGGTRVKGFLGEVNGQQVAAFVFKEGPYQGQLASSVIPSANQLTKWGVP